MRGIDESHAVRGKWSKPEKVRAIPRRSVAPWGWALSAYCVVSVLTIGRYAIAHPKSVCACVGTEDPAAYMWALSWWPHALVHGLNPFVAHELWSPTGVNLAQAAMIPAAAIVMAPVTALAGPIFSYNVLSIMSPVLAAMGAYFLCLRVTRRVFPAVFGGYLYGFSSYEFTQLSGHLNLTLIMLMPLFVLYALRRVERDLSRRAYVAIAATLFALQAGLSTELLAEAVVLGALLLVAARLLAPEPLRARIAGLGIETVCGGLAAAVLISPLLYYAVFSGGLPSGAPTDSDTYALDLLNLFFPTNGTWLGNGDFASLSASFTGGGVSGADGYLSIPLIVAFLVYCFNGSRRRTMRRLLLLGAGVSLLAALGSHLFIAGHETVTLPFNWFKSFVVVDNVLPERIALFVTLAVALGISAWLAQDGRGVVGRWLLVLLGVILILPNVTRRSYGGTPDNPRFFTAHTYKRYLTPGENLLALPYGLNGVSMLWQAETGFDFRMAEGYVSRVTPAPFNADPTVAQMLANVPPPAPSLGTFIRLHAVKHVVIDPAYVGPWPAAMAQLGLRGRLIDGILLYAVPPA